ncbi:hypothetical protein H5410_017816 [Solanum commersonii]|uniref:Uncharacterized protein n=1 Tax=Solanum commersonii TaxID=4109 RepID=A0A9J6A0J6_SOLCO|nr:hypothetical protein H5410_017816 [Solanum commersonii]
MANENLNKLCMDESDPMLNAVVRCKHEILLNLQTSWSKLNPGRRFWSCPCYGVCVFPCILATQQIPSIITRNAYANGEEDEKE